MYFRQPKLNPGQFASMALLLCSLNTISNRDKVMIQLLARFWHHRVGFRGSPSH